jgi:hypothetical protein
MNVKNLRVGMLVYLEKGYQGKFKKCVGKVIAIGVGSPVLIEFSLDGNEPPYEGSRAHIPSYHQRYYTLLPEALEKPKYKSRWWVHSSYLTIYHNNDIVLDGGLL